MGCTFCSSRTRGCRVGEANNLKIWSVEKFSDGGESYYRLNVKGKTGERDVIMRAKLNDIVTSFLNKRLAAGAKPDDLLFRMSNGQKISTLADQFDALLKEAGLTHNSHGEKHTLYSLRHYLRHCSAQTGCSRVRRRPQHGHLR